MKMATCQYLLHINSIITISEKSDTWSRVELKFSFYHFLGHLLSLCCFFLCNMGVPSFVGLMWGWNELMLGRHKKGKLSMDTVNNWARKKKDPRTSPWVSQWKEAFSMTRNTEKKQVWGQGEASSGMLIFRDLWGRRELSTRVAGQRAGLERCWESWLCGSDWNLSRREHYVTTGKREEPQGHQHLWDSLRGSCWQNTP